MDILCPFYQKECITTKCVMWEDECLLISFLHRSKKISNKKVPEEILNSTAEELASEIISFYKKEFPEGVDMNYWDVITIFWKSKGIDIYELPKEISTKINIANALTKSKLKNYIGNKNNKNDSNVELRDIIELTSEELAEDIFLFWKNNSSNGELPMHTVYDLFWRSIGVDQWTPDISQRVKISNAQKLADEKIIIDKLPYNIKTAPPEKIIEFAYDFAKNKYTGSSNIGSSYIIMDYISSFLPSSIAFNNPSFQEKIRIVRDMAQSIILEKENPEVELLIDSFYNWSINNGFKKVTLSDTDAFLSSNKKFLTKESKRILYAKTNVKLKSR